MSVLDFIQVGMPTLDRPFGLQLWPIFEKVFSTIMPYKPQNFRFTPGSTPMSTLSVTTMTLLTYYIVIFGGREFMRDRKALKLQGPFLVHNFYLTAISGSLLGLFIEQLLPTIWRHGVFHAVCHDAGGWTDKLVILYYLNYLTKYLELLDTVFLVLKKKPLTFLHTYHHGATAFLCYSQLLGGTSVSWVPITLNLTVHVLMYWYYFQAARGIKIWWKQYITILQISQFILDLGFVYFASYSYFVGTYFEWMPHYGKCAGEEYSAVSGCVILSSYLVLFIGFYISTYKKPIPKQQMERRGSRTVEALKEMAGEQVPTAEQTRRRFSDAANSPMLARFPGSPLRTSFSAAKAPFRSSLANPQRTYQPANVPTPKFKDSFASGSNGPEGGKSARSRRT